MDKKRWAGVVGGGILVLLLCYFVGYQAGSKANPPRTITVDHTEEEWRLKNVITMVERDLQVAQTQVQDLKVQLNIAQNTKVKSTKVTKKPDGTTVTETKETETNTNTSSTTNSNTNTNTNTKTDEHTKTDTTDTGTKKTEDHTKVVVKPARPDWMLGLDAGVNIPSLSTGQNRGSIIPGTPSWVDFSATVGRRVFDLGPFSVYGTIRASGNGTLSCGVTATF